ncbi:hypothetical protein GCM10009557_44500 [Virgisporangium ochraceum]|uniref:Fibronectin type-III domain-containing protein n=1 Tax=Virgisporangium ochraceum TaxID=65505 RepID=A0A8J4EFS8_9ACTN|nr:hypothetical protein Voc01_053240 [Virgisporangium ochraceum]
MPTANAETKRRPSVPSGVTATPGDASALVKWKPPSNAGEAVVTGYVITAYPGGATVTTTNVTSYQVGQLTNGKVYTFTVAAITAAGTGPASWPTKPIRPKAATPPGTPRAVAATAGNLQAVVTWNAPDNDGGSAITGYRVVAQPGDLVVTVEGDARQAVVTGLTNGKTYRFVVSAVNAAGRGRESDRTRPVTPAIGPPAAPAAVQAAPAGKGGVTVSWEPGDDGGSPITGYEVVTNPGGAVVRTKADTTSTTITGLRNGTAYKFSVRARNAKGPGPALATAATRPDVTIAVETVVLSPESLSTLTEVTGDQTLVFEKPTDQVRALTAGRVVVAGVSDRTPFGLLRKVTSVTTDGTTTRVATAAASLDDAVSNGGLALENTLDGADVEQFRPAMEGVRIVGQNALRAELAGPKLTVAIDVDLVKVGNGKVHVTGSQDITPTVSFDASVRCCFHTDTNFRAQIQTTRKLSLTAEIEKEIKGSIPLGQIYFRPIQFSVGPVPVVVVPRLDLSLESSGKISAGVVTSISDTSTYGVEVATRDGRVTPRTINNRTTSFQPPTVFAAAEFKVGARARLNLLLYGVVGPYMQNTVYPIDLRADTSEDAFITWKLTGTIGAGVQLSILGKTIANWERDPLISFSVTLYESGPLMGVTITPRPVSVEVGGTLKFSATVARSLIQTVNWSVEPGGGTITADGIYTAPNTPGMYRVTTTSPANGLKPQTAASIDVEVTPKTPAPNTADVLVVGSGVFGDTNGADWLQAQLRAAGYTVEVIREDALPANLSGYGQIWHLSVTPLPAADLDRLAAYVKAGGSVYLTGERPCCEGVNAAATTLVKSVVPGAADVQIGNLGDPFYETGPVPVNTAAVDGIGQRPFALSTWTVSAPGGMSGVAGANVFASGPGPDGASVPVAAVWGPDQVTGRGRVAVLMDINWTEPAYMDATTAGQIAQNLALFLSGDSAPPAAAATPINPAAEARTLAPSGHSPTAAN